MGSFISGRTLARTANLQRLWHQYAKSMRKRRPGSELGHNSFCRHAAKHSWAYTHGASAVLGSWEEYGKNVFVVSHFCPFSQREGVELLRTLRNEEFTVVFAVTEDMVGMLVKLGYRDSGKREDMWFKDTVVTKAILGNF